MLDDGTPLKVGDITAGTVVTVTWPSELRQARNAKSWALGEQKRNGFHVRKVVWGLLMASMEKRPGEEIRRAVILVGGKR
jgi:hypothetical protein